MVKGLVEAKCQIFIAENQSYIQNSSNLLKTLLSSRFRSLQTRTVSPTTNSEKCTFKNTEVPVTTTIPPPLKNKLKLFYVILRSHQASIYPIIAIPVTSFTFSRPPLTPSRTSRVILCLSRFLGRVFSNPNKPHQLKQDARWTR